MRPIVERWLGHVVLVVATNPEPGSLSLLVTDLGDEVEIDVGRAVLKRSSPRTYAE
jgi:hypothetical protein